MKFVYKALIGLGLIAGVSSTAFAADSYAPEPVVAASGWYLRGDAGWSWLNTDHDSGSTLVLGGGVGYQFNDNLRADLRGDYAGVGNSNESFTSVLGNVYFDIPTQTILTPYVGAGIGYGWSDSHDSSNDGVAFALMAGVGFRLTDNLTADVGYRYRQIISEDVYDNEALVGLRFSF